MTSTITTTTTTTITTTTTTTTTLHTTMSTVPSSSTSSFIPITDDTSVSSDDFPTVSYIFPLIGVLFIIVEIIVHCIIYHVPKKKKGFPSKGYRRASNGSIILQQEAIQPVNAQTTHSAPSPVQDDESYLNI